MKRISRLIYVPGFGNSFNAILFLFLLFFTLQTEIQRGNAFIIIPVFLVGIAAPYYIRNWLVSTFPTSRKLMNWLILLFLGLARLLAPPKGQAPPAGYNIIWVAVISVYLGCYFWLFSDERLQGTSNNEFP